MKLLTEQIGELKRIELNRPMDQTEIDPRVAGLCQAIKPRYINKPPLFGRTVLEIGSLDGYHTYQLEQAGAFVTATDIRPINLFKTLYRCLYHGCGAVIYRLLDMETMHQEIKKDEFNILFMSGVIYHLSSPYEVMFNIKDLFEYILIEGHIAELGRHQPLITREYNGKIYEGWYYPEQGWSDTQSSKDAMPSFWFTRESLKQLFIDCNLTIVKEIYKDYPNPHGVRDCYLLQRNRRK